MKENKRKKILKIFRENTGGKVTHTEHNGEPNEIQLVGWQRPRIRGIATLGSPCRYGE
jgi:hypothetical protein